MSADNGYAVMRLEDNPRYYGVFYYNASAYYPLSWYEGANAVETCISPTDAIIRAHERDNRDHTEYKVMVSSVVLEDARRELNAKLS